MATEDLQSISTVSSDAPARREQLAALLDAAPQAPVEEQAPAADPESETRPRDETGKFVAVDAAAVASPAAAVADPAPVAEEPVWKRPPASWKREHHEVWAAAAADPKFAQLVEYAHTREDEMRRGIEPLIPKARFADEMYKAIEPYSNNQKAAGVEPVAAMTALMQADDILRNAPIEQKKAYALNLLAQYGLTFEEGELLQIQAAPPPPVNVSALVKREISAWQAQQEDAVIMAEIAEFSRDKPDFESLKPAMKALLENNLVPDIASAYEKAKRLDDTSFRTMKSAHQADSEAAKRAAADQAAKSARAAAVSARSSSPGAPPTTKAQDRRSQLSEQLDGIADRF